MFRAPPRRLSNAIFPIRLAGLRLLSITTDISLVLLLWRIRDDMLISSRHAVYTRSDIIGADWHTLIDFWRE